MKSCASNVVRASMGTTHTPSIRTNPYNARNNPTAPEKRNPMKA
eukprot:CAMPEP_0201680442 /NCGR_PEP_ID=MMETSP0494-20130426/50602_1 /ASSEMBLY_ACC=CAM_ASM_000839 /TAXON_ID=420259 /ORGANISM="Thalassiosira gravida, Strain GMp14c1" /LENGTH=43 /DNA_ID= /DNA_START= /DNA_END= /DNA_ORIENTATION=